MKVYKPFTDNSKIKNPTTKSTLSNISNAVSYQMCIPVKVIKEPIHSALITSVDLEYCGTSPIMSEQRKAATSG